MSASKSKAYFAIMPLISKAQVNISAVAKKPYRRFGVILDWCEVA
ncbi:hypothetical protein CZ674_01465 [Agrococcus casei LMG 22410]|uniref:Uncharacterized protein n=1 Tax=Agrococcus casei LMG 22410 TaxID=1255656 RepID=A0A1R4EXK2_9MICO|nr:hypothetical protein CZ674_01465 [Agrococcus casei LMG 22410]